MRVGGLAVQVAAIPQEKRGPMVFPYTGIAQVADGANEGWAQMQRQIVSNSATVRIENLELIQADLPGAGGNCVFVLSDTDWNTAGNNIALTIPAAAHKALAVGSFEMASAQPLYGYFTTINGTLAQPKFSYDIIGL